MFSTVFKPFHGSNSQDSQYFERGNAMIYVLLAIALFGVLTATLSGQNSDADGQDIDDEQIEFYASELLEYSAAAKSVIDQMLITGSTIDDLDFINPTSAGFDTPPHIHKVFHPSGGGLNYNATPNNDIMTITDVNAGWHTQKSINVDWTPTSSNDVLLSAYQINRQICEKINSKISGSDTVPTLTSSATDYFIDDATNTNLTVSACASCEGFPSLCVENAAQTNYTFYTILAAR